jgi:uncharacterized protein YuzE
MNVSYDSETDTLVIVLREAAIAESDEEKPGFILDYDEDGGLVAVEVLDASTRVADPRRVVFTEVA